MSHSINYTILADPIRGWQIDNKGKICKLGSKRKPGLARISKYRKMLKSAGIRFEEIFIPSDIENYPESLKELHESFREYDPIQDLYVFIFKNNQ